VQVIEAVQSANRLVGSDRERSCVTVLLDREHCGISEDRCRCLNTVGRCNCIEAMFKHDAL